MILHFTKEHGPQEGFCRSQVPGLEAITLILLTKRLRDKLWVYDVVSCLAGLHYMEAAVARAVERSLQIQLVRLQWSLFTVKHCSVTI